MIEFLKDQTIRKHPILKLLINEEQTYLYQTGWLRSFKQKLPVDRQGNPMPWLSLPAIHFLAPRLSRAMDLFEYGAGNSTLYYARRVNTVHTVEHDEAWFRKLAPLLPPNATCLFRSLDAGNRYAASITEEEKSYDVIVIDGRKRNECAAHAVSALKEDGVIVFDDYDREEYHAAGRLLGERGFRCLEFWGMALGSFRYKSTAVFYREANCLGI